MGLEPPSAERDDIYLTDVQVHNPELGILENRVGKMYLEELFNDSGVDLEETAYWFHTPKGGWKSRPVKKEVAEEAPVTFPEPLHLEAVAEGRTPLEELEEGSVITGVITDCWLYHGIQVDFGAEADGLVPIPQDTWMEGRNRQILLPGDTVTARVYKVRHPGLYRWPVQLVLLDPEEVARQLPPPETYQAPIDHGWAAEQGWGIDEICEATGRTFEPSYYSLNVDDEPYMLGVEMAYGYDDEASNFYMTDPNEDYMMQGPGQILIREAMSSVSGL